MKVRKVYVTKYADLSHAVLSKGNRVRILFTGANPSPKRYGTLITEDEDLQEAIESDRSYGVLFELQSETEVPEPIKKSAAVQPMAAMASQAVATAVEKGATATDTTEVEEELEAVTNFNKAREYLRTKYSIQMSQMLNTQAVLGVAAKLGVSFPSWKPINIEYS